MKMARTSRLGLGGLYAFVALCWSPVASAQFFAASDADVVGAGEVEGETIAESGVDGEAPLALAMGLSPNWEAAISGEQTPLGEVALPHRFIGSSISVKRLVVPGSLQGAEGFSAALEVSWELPDTRALRSALALSRQGSWATLHLNGALSRGADGVVAPELLTLIEGPPSWSLRPAIELYTDPGDVLATGSRWGVVWELSDRLALAAGAARQHQADAATEYGFGLSWSTLE